MENSNFSEHLGINKMGKNIRKSPLHQPNFANPNKQQPQPQVYNISKNDFRNIVQQLTGSPSQEPLPRPPSNPPKPPSMRLQKIRPPPLNPINRPEMPPPAPAPAPFNQSFISPGYLGQPLLSPLPAIPPGESFWANTAETPITAYMRYLIDSGPRQTQVQPPLQAQAQGYQSYQSYPSSPGLLPNPNPPVHGFRSPQGNISPLLPSPTSLFPVPSPSSFWNILSPRSPYPLLSPGFHYPPASTPNFSFSPLSQLGILGPGPGPQLPPSPGILFPLSPSGFFPIYSPRWRDQ